MRKITVVMTETTQVMLRIVRRDSLDDSDYIGIYPRFAKRDLVRNRYLRSVRLATGFFGWAIFTDGGTRRRGNDRRMGRHRPLCATKWLDQS